MDLPVTALIRRGLLEAGFRRRGPWVTQFAIDGHRYGGEVSFAGDARVEQFWSAFPKAERVLDTGAFEGGLAFELARRAAHVTAVEARAANVERARFAKRALAIGNVGIVQADLEVVGPDAFGMFDAVFCCGLLYHLSRPGRFVDRLRRAAPAAFIWTHYAADADTVHGIDGIAGRWTAEWSRPGDDSGGLGRRSFWPTLDALVDRLRTAGFDDVSVLSDDPDHPGAPAATVVARATS